MDGVLHVNELEVIKIGNQLMLPQFVDLQFLEKLGFKKTKEYNPIAKENEIVWVKNPERKKKKMKIKKGCV